MDSHDNRRGEKLSDLKLVMVQYGILLVMLTLTA